MGAFGSVFCGFHVRAVRFLPTVPGPPANSWYWDSLRWHSLRVVHPNGRSSGPRSVFRQRQSRTREHWTQVRAASGKIPGRSLKTTRMTAGAYAHPHLPRPEAMSLSVPLEVSDNEKGVQLRRLNALLRVGMAPAAGLEPATKWLTATYSTD